MAIVLVALVLIVVGGGLVASLNDPDQTVVDPIKLRTRDRDGHHRTRDDGRDKKGRSARQKGDGARKSDGDSQPPPNQGEAAPSSPADDEGANPAPPPPPPPAGDGGDDPGGDNDDRDAHD